MLEVIGVGSVLSAGLIAQIPAESVEAIGKWPVTLALIALSAWSVWLAFRMADKQAKAMKDLAEQLAQRPCIRRPENN
jgi:hypothetical protein